MNKWIDISVPLEAGMVGWPNDPSFQLVKYQDMEKGDHNNISVLTMGSHAGTHLDAPRHFIRKGKTLDSVSLDSLIGPVKIFNIKDKKAVTIDELMVFDIRKGDRVIFKTLNSKMNWSAGKFNKDFIFITESAAAYLVKKKVSLVGIDYLSVGQFNNGIDTHKKLLKAGIFLLEGVILSGVKSGVYDLICLPLRIKNGDGSPVRAIIRKK